MTIEAARAHVQETRRRWYQDLGQLDGETFEKLYGPLPTGPVVPHELYLANVPLARREGLSGEPLDVGDRPDIVADKAWAANLALHVDRLADALRVIADGRYSLDGICFGTIPGGGLDAYSERVDDDSYAVLIPDGYFALANLFVKLIAALQPFVESPDGRPEYPAWTAELQEMQANESEWLGLRTYDLLRAYFIHGQPHASLPYRRVFPFEDRTRYLLEGADLFLVAHEAAHCLLGHLDGSTRDTVADELEADAFALKVLTADFAPHDASTPRLRARLCALVFHFMHRTWQTVLSGVLADEFEQVDLAHPPADVRERSSHEDPIPLPHVPADEPPPVWATFVLHAIILTGDVLTARALPNVIDVARTHGLSSRVLPPQLKHLGKLTETDPTRRWAETIADLLTSSSTDLRAAGLWYMSQLPELVVTEMCGPLSEGTDGAWSARCLAALAVADPSLESELPALTKCLQESFAADAAFHLELDIAHRVVDHARQQLGSARLLRGPDSPEFYSGKPGRSDVNRRRKPCRPSTTVVVCAASSSAAVLALLAMRLVARARRSRARRHAPGRATTGSAPARLSSRRAHRSTLPR